MSYSKRDLRAADMLALIFVGLGLAAAAFGVIVLASSASDSSTREAVVIRSDDAKSGVPVVHPGEKRPAQTRGPYVAPLVVGGVFLSLGTALNLMVRQLKRTGGNESADYEGVPEA